jgi:hypothetical protein
VTLRKAVFLLPALLLASCGGRHTEGGAIPISMSAGAYKVAYGQGYAAADETAILKITARLDRSAGRMSFTLADGSQRTLLFSPRPASQWKPDCYTMNSHLLCEVADLSPGSLQLESMTFSAPVVYAKCDSNRIILTHSATDETVSLVFILN